MSYYNRQNKSTKVVKKDLEPTEDSIHLAVIDWLKLIPYKEKTLEDYFHHSPNGGTSSPRQKAKFKRMGTKNGYCDLQLDIARKGYHGLRLELKREKKGIVSADQKERIDMLNDENYYAVVTRGYAATIEVIEWYMGMEGKKDG